MLRVPHERKKENRKLADLPADQPLSDEQTPQRGEGAQTAKNKARATAHDGATTEGPSLGKTGPRNDAKGKASPWPQAQSPCVLQTPFRV